MPQQKTLLVLGLGNDILTDDAVGLLVVRRLSLELRHIAQVEFRETTEMGLALLDYFVGFSRAVVVDSIQTGNAPAGFVHKLGADTLAQLTGRTPHFVGVGDTLALGRKLGLQMPDPVHIFAIEVADPFTLGTSLTPALSDALPRILDLIRGNIETFADCTAP